MAKITDKERMEISDQRNYYACMSNELIQKTTYTMTAQQYDLLMYIIGMVQPTDEPGKTYSFTLKEFCLLCNKDYKNGWYYVSIKSDLKSIADTSVYVPIGANKRGKTEYDLLRWFRRVKVDDGGNYSVSFDTTMYPHLYNLVEKYAMIQRKYVLPLSTFGAKRLYCFLRSFLLTRKEEIALRLECNSWDMDVRESQKEIEEESKTTRTFSVEEIRREMAVDGYEKYYDFNRYVLQKACEEINRFTDIEISCIGKTSKGNGRSITHIAFTMRLLRLQKNTLSREYNRAIVFDDEFREANTDENGNPDWYVSINGATKPQSKIIDG